jgi:hypothetical protein
MRELLFFFIIMMEFSERESKLFDLRFGRATIPSDSNNLNEVIVKSKALDLDYLRVKIVDPDSHFLEKLSRIEPRAYLMGIIKLYKRRPGKDHEPISNPDLVFKKVTEQQKLFFKDFIRQIYVGCPMGFHRYPEIEESFPLDLQLENIGSYFADYFSGADETRESYIGYMDDQPVACFVMDFSDPKVASCLYAGVIQAYRSKGVFKDAITHLTSLADARGIRQVIAGGRLENLSSEYGMSKDIGICYGHEWVYLLSFKK